MRVSQVRLSEEPQGHNVPGPHSCPLCQQTTLERILGDVEMAAKIKGDGEDAANGIVAYRCTLNGHIFFVRQDDIDEHFADEISCSG